MELCLLCNSQPKHQPPSKGSDFICGTCVQHLLKFSQEELRRGLKIAQEKGYNRKITALKMFIKEKNDGEQRKPEPKQRERYINRARIVRPVRHQARNLRRIPV